MDAARLRELLDYDPETGIFRRRRTAGGVKAGAIAGTPRKQLDYVVLSLDHKKYLAHRLAWLYIYGEWPQQHIDHIDHDGLNNRFANLRDVSRSINQQNRAGPTCRNRTGTQGVRERDGKLCAEIRIDGRSVNLGRFQNKEQASAAYREAKQKYHPGFIKD